MRGHSPKTANDKNLTERVYDANYVNTPQLLLLLFAFVLLLL